MCAISNCNRDAQQVNMQLLATCFLHTTTCACCECIVTDNESEESHLCVECEKHLKLLHMDCQVHTTHILDLVESKRICNDLKLHVLLYSKTILDASPSGKRNLHVLVKNCRPHLSRFHQIYLNNLVKSGKDDLSCIEYILKHAKPCMAVSNKV